MFVKAISPPLNFGFNANFAFAFQAIQKLYAHYTNLCFAIFCKFLDDFLEDSFSQRIIKESFEKYRLQNSRFSFNNRLSKALRFASAKVGSEKLVDERRAETVP